MANVAFLGTGLIGSAMVERACRRGDAVTVWNRTSAKARALETFGARVAASIAEAVRDTERVHVVVSDDAAVDAVVDALPDRLSAVVVDHSTVSPQGTVGRFERAAARGLELLHAPIFMSPQAARDGAGVMLCSGPEARFRRVESALAGMTGTLRWLGERVDEAAAFKLFGNAMILTIVGGLADVYRMARELGIDPVHAHGLFSIFKPTMAIDVRGAKMARGDFTPSFETTMARKDLRLMTEITADLAVLPAVAALVDRAIAAGHGSDDVGAVAAVALGPRLRS
jgi:3-hydroxyisobutyrate dehydrogenase-like beta-hydroxyacid dehydrogenase